VRPTVGLPDLVKDPRFATNPDRMAHREALVAELESALKDRDTDDWVEALLAAGVPAGPIRNYEQVCEDPHTQAREMVVDMSYPVEGVIHGLGIPIKLSETPGRIRRAAPLLGQHTDEVLERCGYTHEQIVGLREQGAVG